MLRRSLTFFLATCSLLLHGASARRFGDMARGEGLRNEEAMRSYRNTKVKKGGNENFRFLNANTTDYRVKSLPDVNYDIGEMYSGLIPVDEKNKSRTLFFVFQPTIGNPVEEITIWMNGGPGYSSLDGFFQENGRFLWLAGSFLLTENPYSWANLTNMLWFSISEITAKTQQETAQDFVNFFENFQKIFGIKNFKIYASGESYAGRYVPYISAAMLDKKNKTHFDLRGALVYDPCIGSFDYVQNEVPAVPFAQTNQNLFKFNDTFMAELEKLDKSCGYADFRDKYFRFPPTEGAACDVFIFMGSVAMTNNPCFNVYDISDHCPFLWGVLGSIGRGSDTSAGDTTYFNRPGAKTAMHALEVDWMICAGKAVFIAGDAGPESEGDLSADPIQRVLPQVIEVTNRVFIGNGDLDMILVTNGTLMSIQNMTWNGKLGFQQQPSTPIEITLPKLQYGSALDDASGKGVDTAQGVMGIQHSERGLLWAETYLSGHMQPQYQPRVSYGHLEWLLGRVEKI